ncbi:MAG: PHP domain-containing protein [Planctomycetes bacterium]|nr:PHP domain-containing protein [Planctomycetota bacterium]
MSTFGLHCDFHSHTTASDGSLSPRELVEEAVKRGVSTLALTDHDTTAGIAAAQAAARELGLNLVPGVEITCEAATTEVHLLGLGIDVANAQLQILCVEMQKRRITRFQRMHQLLGQHGLHFPLPEIPPGTSPSRPLMARALVNAGHARDLDDAFNKYLKRGRPGYVPHTRESVKTAIEAVHAAGGIAVLAHPGIYGNAEATIDEAVRGGVDGIECVHPDHDHAKEVKYTERARRHGLLISGGADFHGPDHQRSHWFGKKFCPPNEAVRLELAMAGK